MLLNGSGTKFALKVAVGMFEFVPAAWQLIRGNAGPHPGLGQASLAPPDSVEVEELEKYRLGVVLDIRASELLVQVMGKGELRFVLSTEAIVWDDRWVKDIPLRVGDRVLARGSERDETVFEVTQLYVNMVDVVGAVLTDQAVRGSSQVELQDQRGEKHAVILDDRTMVLPSPDEELPYGTLVPLAGRVAALDKGQPVHVIGRLWRDALVLAVTLDVVARLEND